MSIEWNFDEETQSRIQKALDLINLGCVELSLARNKIEQDYPNQDHSNYSELTKELHAALRKFDTKLKPQKNWYDYSKEEIVIALGKYLEMCKTGHKSKAMELLSKVVNNSVDEKEKKRILSIVDLMDRHVERAKKTKRSINF